LIWFSFFKNATEIAEAMVKKYGMSEKVGFRVHKDVDGEHTNYSSTTNELVDDEIKRLLQVLFNIDKYDCTFNK
jgi:ATP-dependent Zn protease